MSTVREALHDFYDTYGLGDDAGVSRASVSIYAGCLYVAVPNIEARRNLVHPHDIHHVLNGYGTDRIGEGEIGAWELGTGTWRMPLVWIMNLMAFSTGYLHDRVRVRDAFLRGCRSRHLYGQASVDELLAADIEDLRARHVATRPLRWASLRRVEFVGYVGISLVIHALLLVYGVVMHALGSRLVWLGPLEPGDAEAEARRLLGSADDGSEAA